MNGLQLYLRYAGISAHSQLQHRASFIMQTVGSLLTTGIEFAGITALFSRFGSLRSWSLPEIGVFYGVINVAFAMAEGLARGFDVFPATVKSGDFDRCLLRPRRLSLQVAASEIQLMRSGRLLQGGAVLFWSLAHLNTAVGKWDAILIVSAIVTATLLFIALFMIQAALAFWTVESLEVLNTVTYGGTETAQYPLTIYRPWFRRFFTIVVPMAFANYIPINTVLHRDVVMPIWEILLAASLAAAAFTGCAFMAWSVGVRRYHSTGS
jgi:ABC-2 type transport system permease protein